MAFVNPNKPAGLSPVMLLSGADWNSAIHMYAIAAADTNPYYPGDLVDLQNSADSSGLRNITLATAGNSAVGVLVAVGVGNLGPAGAGGPFINANNLALINRPTGAQSQVYYAAVVDDPNVIFEIQEGGAGTNLAAGTAHGNANILYSAPAAGVSVSGTTLNNATVAVTSTLNLKIWSLAQRIDNHFVTSPAAGGGNQKWWVLINNHRFRAGTTDI